MKFPISYVLKWKEGKSSIELLVPGNKLLFAFQRRDDKKYGSLDDPHQVPVNPASVAAILRPPKVVNRKLFWYTKNNSANGGSTPFPDVFREMVFDTFP